jgi:O-antigen/teichoic acid export membrane protein
MGRMPAAETAPPDDLGALAKGGRTNFFGFLLRLAARLPFLFIAGRMYGADALGRFAYATIVVELFGQLATLGLKRGLADALSATGRPHSQIAWEGLVVGWLGSLAAIVVLIALPELMFPNSNLNGLDRLFPLVIIGLVGSDISLAALAYRQNIAATVTARSVIEPWTISIAAFGFAFYSTRDGLILAYVLSIIAAFVASMIPFLHSYGLPHGWHLRPRTLAAMARRNIPLAGADAVEWASRRLDLAILGLFFSPAIVGIYYVAQQVASLPQKLKTSFDPILGPVITRNLAEGNKPAVAQQVAQVGFWILAAQVGVALSLGVPGEAVMGLVGPNFVGGTGALAFLLLAEVAAATAVVSEAALIYVARKRNLAISLAMLAVQAALSFAAIHAMRAMGLPLMWQAAGPALAMTLALAMSSLAKASLLSKLLGARVSGWRWALVPAAAAGVVVGYVATLLPEWLELVVGIPLILGVYGVVIWYRGFGHEDRALFRLGRAET